MHCSFSHQCADLASKGTPVMLLWDNAEQMIHAAERTRYQPIVFALIVPTLQEIVQMEREKSMRVLDQWMKLMEINEKQRVGSTWTNIKSLEKIIKPVYGMSAEEIATKMFSNSKLNRGYIQARVPYIITISITAIPQDLFKEITKLANYTEPTPTYPPATPAEWLSRINQLRQLHCSPPVSWDRQLADGAKQWAEHLANKTPGELSLSPPNTREDIGETVAVDCQPDYKPDGAVYVKEITDGWNDEKKGYDYNNPGYRPGTGSFTQMIWKKTTRVGCASAPFDKLGNHCNVAVCRWAKEGNHVGHFSKNVLPETCHKHKAT